MNAPTIAEEVSTQTGNIDLDGRTDGRTARTLCASLWCHKNPFNRTQKALKEPIQSAYNPEQKWHSLFQNLRWKVIYLIPCMCTIYFIHKK